jgi:hypothetical protein
MRLFFWSLPPVRFYTEPEFAPVGNQRCVCQGRCFLPHNVVVVDQYSRNVTVSYTMLYPYLPYPQYYVGSL